MFLLDFILFYFGMVSSFARSARSRLPSPTLLPAPASPPTPFDLGPTVALLLPILVLFVFLRLAVASSRQMSNKNVLCLLRRERGLTGSTPPSSLETRLEKALQKGRRRFEKKIYFSSSSGEGRFIRIEKKIALNSKKKRSFEV